jgi:hypothetical protein
VTTACRVEGCCWHSGGMIAGAGEPACAGIAAESVYYLERRPCLIAYLDKSLDLSRYGDPMPDPANRHVTAEYLADVRWHYTHDPVVGSDGLVTMQPSQVGDWSRAFMLDGQLYVVIEVDPDRRWVTATPTIEAQHV